MVANPGQQVRVRGANVPMNTEEPSPQPPTPPVQDSQPIGFFGALGNVLGRIGQDISGYFNQPGTRVHERDLWGSMASPENRERYSFNRPPSPLPPAGTTGVMGGRGYIPGQTTPMDMSAEEVPAGLTASEWLGQNVGAFDETPYRNYMDFLATQDAETMARINAMYERLAGEAQANMERVRDIYGSAQMTSGDVYGSAAQNIEGAYGSAQQQAADQMARLGIEAAAPAVINPMALSQAEAIAGVESAGAGALDALTRYGASAQDFGSQMGQVAQQQGLEVSNQILRDMAQRQAEAVFQMEQARANYNPFANAMQQLEFERMYNEPMLRGAEANMEAMQRAAELQLDTTLSRQDKILRIWTDIREDYNTDEEAWQAAVVAVQQAEAMYPIQ